MKLLRYGPVGQEKPGMLDAEGRVRDLSAHVADIADDVEAVITGEPRNLIETVAGEIAERCLLRGRVDRVTVTVHKPRAPLSQTFADVSVTINRSRHV